MKDIFKRGFTEKSKTAASLLLIAGLGFLIYANSLNSEFVWDDAPLIKNNALIKDFSYAKDIFIKDIGSAAGIRYFAWRPLQMLTYMSDYAVWALDVRGYHLINIMLHILTALSIFWLIRLLSGSGFIATITSLLFISHPIHTEAVTYISGRADPMAALFILLSFVFYIKYVKTPRPAFYILVILNYICALLSRESSLIFPVLLLIYHYSFRRKIRISLFFGIIGLVLIYAFLRLKALPHLLPHSGCPTTLLERMPGFFAAITEYLRLLLLPFGLHMEYGDEVFRFTDAKVICGIIITASLLAYAFRKRGGLVTFSILWFLTALVPSSNLYPVNAYMAEHWLYLPSLGFFLITSVFLNRLYHRRKFKTAVIVIIAVVTGAYSMATVRQNTYWQRPVLLYERILKYAGNSVKIHNNLGSIYSSLGRKREALDLYKKAIELDPEHANSYNNIGNIYMDAGRFQEAAKLYKEAIKREPRSAKAYVNLASAYVNLSRHDEAIGLYNKALDIEPMSAEAYYNLGVAYYDTSRIQEAIEAFKKSIELNPHAGKAYNNLGLSYYAMGSNEEAVVLYKKALSIDPGSALVYNNLGIVYSGMKMHKEAIAAYSKAVGIDKGYASAYNNMANEYSILGEDRKAISLYKKAVEAKPDYSAAHMNLSFAYFGEGEYALSIEHCDRAIELGERPSPEFLEKLKPFRKGES